MTDNNLEGQVAEQTQEVSLADELRSHFEPKEEVKEETKELPAEDKTEPTEEAEEVEETAEKPEVDEVEKEFPLVPKDWSAEEKQIFEDALNSEDEKTRLAAELFIERYNNFKKGFTKKSQEFSSKTKELTEINKIFEPFEGNLKANGITKTQYINDLIREAVGLNQNPAGKIKEWVKMYNLKPEQLGFDEYSYLQDDEKSDTSELQQLKAEINSLRNQLHSAPVENQVRQFAEAKDEQGKPLHPHFNEVRGIMGNLISKNPDLTLDQAYKKAVKTIDIDLEQEPEAINLDRIREKVAKAKKASKGVKTNGGKIDFSEMSLTDELKARFNGIN
jgi:hypothetical protein